MQLPGCKDLLIRAGFDRVESRGFPTVCQCASLSTLIRSGGANAEPLFRRLACALIRRHRYRRVGRERRNGLESAPACGAVAQRWTATDSVQQDQAAAVLALESTRNCYQ